MKAWLEGHQVDLAYLAQLLPSGKVKVMRDGDRYYLTSPSIDDPPPETNYKDVAEWLIEQVNGYGSVMNASFRPVQLAGIYDDETGTRIVPAAARLELRAATFSGVGVVTDTSGKATPAAQPPGPAHIALAASNPDVADVLEMMSHIPVGWVDLFKVHERTQDSIHGSIPQMGWASKADDEAFGASANRRDVSGKDARHARREKRPASCFPRRS